MWQPLSAGALRFSNTCCRCPPNGSGFTQSGVAQFKIVQEVITQPVFLPFAVIYLNQSLKWDVFWTGLYRVGAVYFIFRGA